MISIRNNMLQITQINFFFRNNCAKIIFTYFNGHLLGAPGEYALHGLNPGFDRGPCCSLPWAFFLFVLAHLVSCCLLQRLMFSCSNPSLPTGRLHTNVQTNNITTLHDIYTVTHILITFILLLLLSSYFFHSPGQAGWPRPFPSVTFTHIPLFCFNFNLKKIPFSYICLTL